MPCRSSQRLTGQLVTKPSIIPTCIRNQWLELSTGAFQIKYCASAIQPNRPTSKLSTESVSDLIASPSGASRPTWPRSGAITKYWKRIPKIQASGRSRMYSGPSAAVEPIIQAVAQTIHSPPMSPRTQPAPQWLSESDTCHNESRAPSSIPAMCMCIRLRHPPSAREIRPESDRTHVERGERKGDVHDRHVLLVAQHDDVGDDDERGR